MQPEEGRLSMFGRPTDAEPLDWAWVDGELASAEVYWIVAGAVGDRPQARPVWGVWRDQRIEASVGSPRLRATIELGTPVTVHLGGAVDVVIVEGEVTGMTSDPDATAAYDEKYDWEYDTDRYGALTVVRPETVMAWRSTGPAGRDGFVAAGRWRFRW
jgi:hypothetical protein